MRRLFLALALTASTAGAQPTGELPPAPPPPAGAPAPSAAPAPAAPAATPAPAATAPPPYPYAYPYPPPYPYPYPYAPPPPPAILPYNEGEAVPPGYHPESRVRRGPIIFGATMGGSTYLINLLVAGIAEESDEKRGRVIMLYIPGVGTWGYVPDACDSDDACSFLVLHSAAHSIGVAMLLYGLFAPRTVLVRNDVSFRLTPLVGKSLSGLGLGGSF